MLRFGTQVRLTRVEAERFTRYTGFEPVGVKTLEDLDAYVARCKAYYWGVSRDYLPLRTMSTSTALHL